MAINFAAANMAGYNNPQIEVFEFTFNDNLEITESPNQSVLSDCINRGSVPFLRAATTDHNTVYILPITYITQQAAGLEFCFSNIIQANSLGGTPIILAVNYPITGAPTLSVQEIPMNNI